MSAKRLTLTVDSGRRAVFARQAQQRFDRAEQEFAPAVQDAIRQYLAHLRDVWARHDVNVLTAAAGDALAADVAARRKRHGNLTHSEARSRDRMVKDFTVEDADDAADVLNAPAKWREILDHTLMPAYQRMLGPVLQSAMNNPGARSAVTAWRNDYLEKRTQSLVGIPDVVSGQFRTALRDAAAKSGTNVDDARSLAAKMLADGYPSWTSRAQTIARTETVGANNQGSLASFSALASASEQAGTKTWLATPDGRTRDTHVEIDGQSVGLAEKFDVGGQQMNGPGDPDADPGETVNCRCAMTYAFAPDDDGAASDDDPEDTDGEDGDDVDPDDVDADAEGADSEDAAADADAPTDSGGSALADLVDNAIGDNAAADTAVEDAGGDAIDDGADADPDDGADGAPTDYRSMSDDDLADALGTAATDDDVNSIVAELDRRDVAERAKVKRVAKRDADASAKDTEYSARLDAGDDPESAYADVYGRSIEQQRRDVAIASLRANGYKGVNFERLSSAAWRDHVTDQRWDAEAATKGAFFRGTTKANDTRDVMQLFTGSEAYARANASDELLQYWQAHGRTTLADFRASMLSGTIKSKGADAWY